MSVWKHCKYMASQKMQFEQNCANEVFQQLFIVVIQYWISSFYVKHKAYFAHYVYSRVDLCSCVCWSWHFSPDESHSRPSTISSILSVFDRKFRSSLKPLSLSSPKSAAIKTVRFWWVIFSKHDANSSIRWLSSTPTAFASYKVLINISWNETFYFWVALEIVNLCFFCSQHCVLSIPHCAGFPVHGWKLLPIMVRYWVSIVLRIG